MSCFTRKPFANAVCVLVLLSAVLAICGVGCKKATKPPEHASAPSAAPAAATPAATGDTIARIHWVGKKRLAADTNSASLMSVWSLPESDKLEAQTLDKLANFPWLAASGFSTNAPTNAASVQLRPLLEDLVNQECYLEVRQVTNEPGEFALALRLEADRAALWEKNLAGVLAQWSEGKAPTPNANPAGWTLKTTLTNLGTLRLARVGEWIIIASGKDGGSVFGTLQERIGSAGVPFGGHGSNEWLRAELDPLKLVSAFSINLKLPLLTPRLSLTVTGDGQAVITRGDLTFPENLNLDLEPWNIPTNLIHEPLVGFTAIRGIKTLIESSKAWTSLKAGPAPNQAFLWAQNGMPFLSFFAAPFSNASNCVHVVTEDLLSSVNPWVETNSMGEFERAAGTNGVLWSNLPIIAPSLGWLSTDSGDFAFAGLVAAGSVKTPFPNELLAQLVGGTNVVLYDWELTGFRIEGLLHITQLSRMILGLPQLPPPGDAVRWLIALQGRTGNCGTVLTRVTPDRLGFVRRSEAGFSALEAHLLADWLESPRFPKGLHTLDGPPAPKPVRRPRTAPTPLPVPPVSPATTATNSPR